MLQVKSLYKSHFIFLKQKLSLGEYILDRIQNFESKLSINSLDPSLPRLESNFLNRGLWKQGIKRTPEGR